MGPMVMEPMLKERVWGGDRLARWGKPVGAGASIGESWEVADLAEAGAVSVIAEGEMAGRTIREVIERDARGVLGRCKGPSFPLLVKLLDAREPLSVQVHPDKSESWRILEADAGAMVYAGFRESVTRGRLERALRDGAVVSLLRSVPARVGDTHHLAAGTVHALGAGVVVAEVQTPCDTTYRLFDWGRTGREVHIREGLACAALGAYEEREGEMPFVLRELRLGAGEEREVQWMDDAPRVWVVIEGTGSVADVDDAPGLRRGYAETVALARGRTVVLPAAMRGTRVTARDALTILEAALR